MDIFPVCSVVMQYLDMLASVGVTGKQETGVLLWERVQQNAPMVPMRTMRATKAPTAMPMITATGSDSAESNKERCPTIITYCKHLECTWKESTQQHTAMIQTPCMRPPFSVRNTHTPVSLISLCLFCLCSKQELREDLLYFLSF